MISIRRTTVATLALGAVLGLSACDDGTQADGAPPETSSTGQATPEGPATTGEVKDKHALPVQQMELPDGPVTDIDVRLLGGFPTREDYGEFYAVLDVTSSDRGLVELEYVMLDKDGTPLKTVRDSITVSGASHEVKVTRAEGELPAGRLPDFDKVDTVQLKVVRNKEAGYVTATRVKQSSLTIGRNASAGTPTVSGTFRTAGGPDLISMTAVCVDKKGQVRTDSSLPEEIKAPTWTPFTVDVLSGGKAYQPTSCFVGG